MSEPVGETRLIQVSAGEGEDEGDNLLFWCIDPEAVQAEEEIHGLEGYPLVPVQEGMIARKPEPICGSDRGKIGLGIVEESIARAFQGGLQEAPVPQPEGAAVGLDLISVDGEDLYRGNPAWLSHLASSRMALR